MCSPVAAIAGVQVGLNAYSNYKSQKAQAKAAQEQMDAQAKAAVTEMNWNIMDLEQQRTDAFDMAVAEISNTRMNSQQLNSGVKAAVAETMSGRTADMLVRNVEGDTARAVASIQDNYDRKSNEVDLNKERAVLSTRSYIENLNASAPKMPSRTTNFLSFAGDALGAWASVRGNSGKGGSSTKGSTTTTATKMNVPTFKPAQYVTPARQTFINTYGSEWDKQELNALLKGKAKQHYLY